MFCAIDLAIFRWNALYESNLGISFATFPSSMGIDTAYTYSIEPSPGMSSEFFRNSYWFSRKTLVKIVFCTIDLAIFRWNALYGSTLGTSFAIFPSSMAIDTAYTYSIKPSLGTSFGIFSKFLLVFEKNTWENRVLHHRLGHCSVKCPIRGGSYFSLI